MREDCLHANSGYGPRFSVLDIGLEEVVAVIEADTAFWALVETGELTRALRGELVAKYEDERQSFQQEMHAFRYELRPSAVYFNPTERCNFNCSYCYLPEDLRRSGQTMTPDDLHRGLEILRDYFRRHLPETTKPQLVFHGSEPLLCREAVFEAIETFSDDFVFGIQTNGALLDDEGSEFLRDRGVGIGLSLDAPDPDTADSLRHAWGGKGAFHHLLGLIDRLADYPGFNVITTVTHRNVTLLPTLVDFYAEHGVRTVMLNPVRCTQKGGAELKPDDGVLAHYFCAALDRTRQLREETGQKVVIANFANMLAAILGPTTRRLMCDISPCGGGRCFFAVSAVGDVFPCSEFIGLAGFSGGNLFHDPLPAILESRPFRDVTSRVVEAIEPCRSCAIRHYCGAPCPAEVRAFAGTLSAPAPYCRFYEQIVRYAFRTIARGDELGFLWDSWDRETLETFNWA